MTQPQDCLLCVEHHVMTEWCRWWKQKWAESVSLQHPEADLDALYAWDYEQACLHRLVGGVPRGSVPAPRRTEEL